MKRTNREVYLFFALSFFSHYDLIRLAPGTCLVKPFAKPSSPRQNNASISDTIWGGGHHLGRRPHGPITMLMKPGHQPSARLPPPVLLFGAWHSRLTSGEMRYAAWRGNMYLLPSLSWLEREAVLPQGQKFEPPRERHVTHCTDYIAERTHHSCSSMQRRHEGTPGFEPGTC